LDAGYWFVRDSKLKKSASTRGIYRLIKIDFPFNNSNAAPRASNTVHPVYRSALFILYRYISNLTNNNHATANKNNKTCTVGLATNSKKLSDAIKKETLDIIKYSLSSWFWSVSRALSMKYLRQV